uniref:Zinc finger protein 28-like n=1 Tax=Hirondellea gigas TaxID=1518452 RepID=A0A6A7G1Q7_9CRUS
MQQIDGTDSASVNMTSQLSTSTDRPPSTSSVAAKSVVNPTSPAIANSKHKVLQTTLARTKTHKTTSAFVKRVKTDAEKKRPARTMTKYTCSHCDFETTNLCKHYAHKHQHRDLVKNLNVFKCHNCEYSSKIKGGLQRHIKRVHTKERPFTCPVCNFRTIDKPSMAKHIIKLHKEDIGDDLDIYVECMKGGSAHNSSKDKEGTDEENKAEDEGEISTCDESIECHSEAALQDDGQPDSEKPSHSNMGKSTHYEDYDIEINDGIKVEAVENENNVVKYANSLNKNSIVENNFLDSKIVKDVKTDLSVRRRPRPSAKYKSIYCTPEYREMRSRKLTCEYCQKCCGSRRELLAHTNEHKEANVHCPICLHFIVNPFERAQHLENHLQNNPIVCATCLSTFKTESEVVLHQQSEHRKSINVIMECMFCPFSSRSQDRFSRHMTRCHMLASEIPKHNPFDVSKMRQLLVHAGHQTTTMQQQHHLNDSYALEGTNHDHFDYNNRGNVNKKNSWLGKQMLEDNNNNDEEGEESTTMKTGRHNKATINDSGVKMNGKEEHELQSNEMENNEQLSMDARNDSSFMDYSLLDLSAELDESIENFEALLERTEQFHGFNSSHEEPTDFGKLESKHRFEENNSHAEKISNHLLPNSQSSENSSKSYAVEQYSSTSQETTTQLTNQTYARLYNNNPSTSKLSAFNNCSQNTSNLNAFQNTDSSPLISGEFEQQPALSNAQDGISNTDHLLSLNHSRISSIATSLACNKNNSISAINTKRMKSRKVSVAKSNASRASRAFPSPDSTSREK